MMTEDELLARLQKRADYAQKTGYRDDHPYNGAQILDDASAHIRAQSAEIAQLKMGLSLYASDMAQFDLSKTRTALKGPSA